MSNINFMKRIKKSEAGFTMIELLIATVMSLVILGLLAHVFRSQQKEFGQQTGLNTLQANGRAATEMVSRSVQAAGYNVTRGTRFLTASDHYLTTVYDEDNDNVIQNDEVMTYSLANAWSGTASDNHPFVARFDVNSNGVVEGGENPTVPFQMTTSGPPFNLYKVTPTATGTAVQRSLLARNIDNMVIKYYDRNGRLLPIMKDTTNPPDGTGDIAFDANNDGVPDDGNWDFVFPINELNDIRKVEIEILARSRKGSARETTSAGTYLQGSLAALTSGSVNYSDQYLREDFSAEMAPRNLVLAPWGSVDIRATPTVVACPTTTSNVTATLLDANGDAVSGSLMTFTSTGGTTITVATPNPTSDTNGEGDTDITFDYTTPFYTATVSASANVIDGGGTSRPIFSAAPVRFAFGTQGGFADPFDGTQPEVWTALGADNFEIPIGEEYFVSSRPSPIFVGSINGCASWRDMAVQVNLRQEGGAPPPTWQDNDFAGIILRYQDALNYYWVSIINPTTGAPTRRTLQIGRTVAGLNTVLATKDLDHADINIDPFIEDIPYTLKAQILGDDIRVKLWQPADENNPNADEPLNWSLPNTAGGDAPVTDTNIANGSFGLGATDNIFQFDDVTVTNSVPII